MKIFSYLKNFYIDKTKKKDSLVKELLEEVEMTTNWTKEDIAERKRLYEILRDHILKAQLSNSENYDKHLLSLSTAFLGASLTFTDKIVPLKGAWYIWQLYSSWFCFIFAVLSTLISFLVSQKAYDVLLDYSEKYYLEFKEEFRTKKNKWSQWTSRLNKSSALFFITGIILIALFILLNINLTRG